jgi:hypothetical protein
MRNGFKHAGFILLTTAAILGVARFSQGYPHGSKESTAKPRATARPGSAEASSSGQRASRREEYLKLSSADAIKRIKTTMIRELTLEDVTVPEAIEVLNQTLRQESPALTPPKIRLAAAWGNNNPRSQLRIREMRAHDIPLSIALKYICDQYRCRYWIYKGTVFIDLYRFDDELPERFLQQARIETLSIHDANILEAMEALRAAAEEIDFDGCKPPLVFPADSESEDIHAAIVRGDIADRVHDIKLTNATIGEALEEICRQAGAHYVVFEGQIVLILNEIGKKP